MLAADKKGGLKQENIGALVYGRNPKRINWQFTRYLWEVGEKGQEERIVHHFPRVAAERKASGGWLQILATLHRAVVLTKSPDFSESHFPPCKMESHSDLFPQFL